MIAYREELSEITGHPITTLVLSQLLYWMAPGANGKSKLRVEKQGKYWLAKSTVELAREIGASVWQTRNSIQQLEKRRIIVVSKFMFNGHPTAHYRINWEELPKKDKELIQKPDPICGIAHSHLWPTTNPFDADHKSITEITAENTTKIKTYRAKAPATEVPLMQLSATEGKEENMAITPGGKKFDSSAAILAKLQAAKQDNGHKADSPQPYKPQLMYDDFVEILPQAFPTMKMVPSFGIKERSMAKQIIEKLGGDARDIVRYTITHWTSFSKFLHKGFGVAKFPDYPVVNMLLKYVIHAANFWAERDTKPVPKVLMEKKPLIIAKVSAPSPVQSIAKKVIPKVEEDMLSYEDLMKIGAELKIGLDE